MQDEVPALLRKKGITGVTDNLGANEELDIPGSLIFAFFGDEVMAELQRKYEARHGTNQPADPDA